VPESRGRADRRLGEPHCGAGTWQRIAPHPKELIILDGSAHAQFMFETEQAGRVMLEILRFLSPRLPTGENR
jgi:hypothetical protein